MTSVYLGFVAVFSEFGFGSAVINLRDLTAHEIAQINSFSAISGIVGFLVSCALAIPIGWFFRAPALPAVIVVMSANFLITGFKTVPTSMLQREFKFKRLSLIDTLATVTQSLCVLLLAWRGAGYWSLALGTVIASLVSTTLSVASRPSGFARPRLKSISQALNFSWQVLVARLSWTLYSDADFLVAGRVLGASAWVHNLRVESRDTTGRESYRTGRPGDARLLLRKSIRPRRTAALSANTHRGYRAVYISGDDWISVGGTRVRVFSAWRALVRRCRAAGGIGILRVHALGKRAARATIDGSTRDAVRMWINVIAAVVMPTAFYFGSRWGAAGIRGDG